MKGLKELNYVFHTCKVLNIKLFVHSFKSNKIHFLKAKQSRNLRQCDLLSITLILNNIERGKVTIKGGVEELFVVLPRKLLG